MRVLRARLLAAAQERGRRRRVRRAPLAGPHRRPLRAGPHLQLRRRTGSATTGSASRPTTSTRCSTARSTTSSPRCSTPTPKPCSPATDRSTELDSLATGASVERQAVRDAATGWPRPASPRPRVDAELLLAARARRAARRGCRCSTPRPAGEPRRPTPSSSPAGPPASRCSTSSARAPFRRLELAVGPGRVRARGPRPNCSSTPCCRTCAASTRRSPSTCAPVRGALALALADELPGAPGRRGRASTRPRWTGCAATPRAPACEVVVGRRRRPDLLASCAAASTPSSATRPTSRRRADVGAEVRADPAAAVFAGADGLALIPARPRPGRRPAAARRRAGARARRHATATAVAGAARAPTAAGADVADHRDLAGRPRYATADVAAAVGAHASTRAGWRPWPCSSTAAIRTSGSTRSRRPRTASRPASWSCCRPTPSTASAPTRSTRSRSPTCCAAKGRGRDMPVPVLVGSWTTIDGLVSVGRRPHPDLVEAFWPGGLTLVVAARAVADLGPRRRPRHGRGADAAAPGRDRTAREDRTDGGVEREPVTASRPRRPPPRRGPSSARTSRSTSRTARPPAASRPRSSTSPAAVAADPAARARVELRRRCARSVPDIEDDAPSSTEAAAMTHPSLEYLLVGLRRRGGDVPAHPARPADRDPLEALALPRDRDVHAVATPRMGGVALFAGFALALFVAAPAAHPARRVQQRPARCRGSWSPAAIICAVGVLDDRYELDSLTKLAGQVLATGLMVTLRRRPARRDLPARGATRHVQSRPATWPSRSRSCSPC